MRQRRERAIAGFLGFIACLLRPLHAALKFLRLLLQTLFLRVKFCLLGSPGALKIILVFRNDLLGFLGSRLARGLGCLAFALRQSKLLGIARHFRFQFAPLGIDLGIELGTQAFFELKLSALSSFRFLCRSPARLFHLLLNATRFLETFLRSFTLGVELGTLGLNLRLRLAAQLLQFGNFLIAPPIGFLQFFLLGGEAGFGLLSQRVDACLFLLAAALGLILSLLLSPLQLGFQAGSFFQCRLCFRSFFGDSRALLLIQAPWRPARLRAGLLRPRRLPWHALVPFPISDAVLRALLPRQIRAIYARFRVRR